MTESPDELAALPPDQAAWVKAFTGIAFGDAVKAATIAGFADPQRDGPRLQKRLTPLLGDWRTCGPRESIHRISGIAREPRNPNQLKALELLLKVHGLLSDKLDVNVSRADLLKQVSTELHKIRESRAQLVDLSQTSEKKDYVSKP